MRLQARQAHRSTCRIARPRSATTCGPARDPRELSDGARGRPARERPRRDRRHRHRGALGDHLRPQRAVAVGAAARARGRQLAEIVIVGDRPDDMRAALRLPRPPGRRPDRHERRPRADRGRPHRRGRGGVRRPPAGPRRGAGGADLGASWSACAAAGATSTRTAIRAGNRKQALVPDGRDGARAGRHRARARRASPRRRPDRARAARARRASCSRCGRRRSRRRRCARLLARAGTLRAADPAAVRASRSREIARSLREIEADGVPIERSRSRPACAAASSRSRPSSSRRRRRDYDALRGRDRASATATRCSRDDGSTIDEQVVALLDRAARSAVAESCTGGLMAGRLTDARGLLGVRAGRRRRLLERGQDRAGGRARGADRGARARSRPRSRRRWPTARERAFGADDRHRDHRDRRPGRRDAGEAGRDGLPERRALRGRAQGPDACTSPATARRPRPHDDRRCMHGLPRGCCDEAAAVRRARPARAGARRAGRVPRAAADPAVWRPVPDEALHLTLAFLGHRPETDVAAIVDVLRSAPMHAPRLALGRALLLPPKRPRVLTAEVADPDGSLRALQRAVSDGLGGAAALHAGGAGRSAPHATVARLRPRRHGGARRAPAPEPLEFRGEALTLYQSQPASRGRALRAARDAVQLSALGVAAGGATPGGRLLGALALVLLVLPVARASARLRWTGCGDVEAACTRVARAARPHGRGARARCGCGSRASATPRGKPTLLYLSGGPGGAGVREFADVLFELGRARAPLPAHLLRPARHRLLGAAPLPGARARPARCARTRAARRARRGSAPRRELYTTRDSVEDIEALRRALRRREADAVRHLLRHEARARLRARPSGARRAAGARLGRRPRRRRPVRARAVPRDGGDAAVAVPGAAAA